MSYNIAQLLKSSKFWDEEYNNFQAFENGAEQFLRDNGLTLDGTIGTETGIKAVTGFQSRYELLKSNKNVSINTLKNSTSQHLPIMGEIYVIDQEKVQQREAEAEARKKRLDESVAVKIYEDSVKNHLKNAAFLAKCESFKKVKDNEKNWKYIFRQIFGILLNEKTSLVNEWGSSTINPAVNLTGNAKNGYTLNGQSFDFDTDFESMAVNPFIFETDEEKVREYYKTSNFKPAKVFQF